MRNYSWNDNYLIDVISKLLVGNATKTVHWKFINVNRFIETRLKWLNQHVVCITISNSVDLDFMDYYWIERLLSIVEPELQPCQLRWHTEYGNRFKWYHYDHSFETSFHLDAVISNKSSVLSMKHKIIHTKNFYNFESG